MHDDWPGEGQRDDPQRAACVARGLLEPLEVVQRSRVIVVRGIVLDGEDDRIRRHEARHIIDVTVRVVADAPCAEPDRTRHAKPFRERALVLLARHAGVAHLHVAQQPFFGDEHQPIAVHFDAASFEHDARLDTRQPRDASDRFADLRVALPVVVLRPRVERPVDEHDAAVLVAGRRRR